MLHFYNFLHNPANGFTLFPGEKKFGELLVIQKKSFREILELVLSRISLTNEEVSMYRFLLLTLFFSPLCEANPEQDAVEMVDLMDKMQEVVYGDIQANFGPATAKYPSCSHEKIPISFTTKVFLASSTPSQNLSYRAFVTAPSGKTHYSDTITTNSAVFDLPTIELNHSSSGIYTAGYIVSLPLGSAPLVSGLSCTGWVTAVRKNATEISPIPGIPILSSLLNSNQGVPFVVSSDVIVKFPSLR